MSELKYLSNLFRDTYTNKQLITFLELEIERGRAYARSMFILQALATLLLYLFTPSSVTARLWGNSGGIGDIIFVLYIVSLLLLICDFLFKDILNKEFVNFTRYRWIPISILAITYWLTATISLLQNHEGGLGILTLVYCMFCAWGMLFAWHVKTTDYRFRDFLAKDNNDKL